MANLKFVGHLPVLKKCTVVILVSIVTLLILVLKNVYESMSVSNHPVKNSDSEYDGSLDRIVELPEWKRGQSLAVEDYLNLTDDNNYLRKPLSRKEFGNVQYRFCGPQVEIIVLVSSLPKNLDRRNAIRETWGSDSNLLSNGVRIVFGLGLSESGREDTVVEREAKIYDDIIQEPYVESFYNLTFKTLSLLKWVKLTCSLTDRTNVKKSLGPKFVLKTDDDVFVNIHRMIEITKLLPEAGIIGLVRCNTVPSADWTDMYYIPKYLYAPDKYPGYVIGQGYLIRSAVIPTLLRNAERIPLIHIEDVYVTALIARPSHIYPYHYKYFANNKHYGDELKVENFENWVTIHRYEATKLRSVWSWRNRNKSYSANAEITSLPSSSKKPVIC